MSKGGSWLGEIDWSDPALARQPVTEYLNAVERLNKPSKAILLTDPGPHCTSAMGGPAYFAWSANNLVDVGAAIIVDVEPSPAIHNAEVGSTRLMIDRTETRFGLKPKRLIDDSAYGAAEMLAWTVEEKAIAPHVSLRENDERSDRTFGRSRLVLDEASNSYRCPGGKSLKQYQRRTRTQSH